MKFKNTDGEWQEFIFQANDSIPAGAIIEYNGTKVPEGYEEVKNTRKLEVLPEGTNIDNLIERFLNNTVAIFNATGTLPFGYSTSDNNIILTTILWGDDFGRQICQDVRTKRTSVRNLSSGVWLPWIDIDDNYSTEEKCIGTWINGKPLYRKVIIRNINTNDVVTINHNIENIDQCFLSGDSFYDVGGITFPLNYYRYGTDNNIYAHVSANTLSIRVVPSGWKNYYAYFIIKYTKTTD